MNGTSPAVIVRTPPDAVKTIEFVTCTPATEYVQVARYVPSGKTFGMALVPVVILTPETIVVQPSTPDVYCGAVAPSEMDMIGAGEPIAFESAIAVALARIAAVVRTRAATATADAPVATSTF